jgi:YggT family protein
MHVLATILINLTWAYFAVFMIRLVMGWVFAFAPSYRASGAMAMLLEIVFTLSDPPLRFMRRLIPPLRIGNFSLDLGFFVVITLLYVLARVVWPTLG